jgi:hypothetical protein
MNMPRPVLAFCLIAAAAAAGGGAVAQPKGEGRSQMLQELVDCRKLTDDAARLACYDKASASLDQAEQKGDIVVVDREQARKVRRQAFGFSLPSISLFEKGETQEELENVTGEVAVASVNGAGKWTIRLTDGAVWVQVDNNELHRTPKPGNPVKIRQASLGSFMMSINNGGGFRVRRVE